MGTKGKPQMSFFLFMAFFLLFGMQWQQKEFAEVQKAFEKKIEKQGSLLDQKEKDIQIINQQNEQLTVLVEQQKAQISQQDAKITDLQKEAEEAKKTAMPSRGQVETQKKFYVEATGYTAYCKGCSGKTKWNELDLRAHPEYKIVAVDPNVIPLGTKVHVEGYGYAVAADTGGAIKGNKVDLFFPETQQALNWGRRTVEVTVYN